jgi:hypothetical protein
MMGRGERPALWVCRDCLATLETPVDEPMLVPVERRDLSLVGWASAPWIFLAFLTSLLLWLCGA